MCGLGPRELVSAFPGSSDPSSRRMRNSNGGCNGPPRSALGPVGGCTDGREDEGGSFRSFSALVGGGGPVGALSIEAFSGD